MERVIASDSDGLPSPPSNPVVVSSIDRVIIGNQMIYLQSPGRGVESDRDPAEEAACISFYIS